MFQQHDGCTAQQASAALPAALVLLGMAAVVLLQAIVRPLLPHGRFQLTADTDASSAYLTAGERRMAQAALGKPVEVEAYRHQARWQLAQLGLVASIAMALQAGHLIWVPLAPEQILHTLLWVRVSSFDHPMQG